MGYNHAKALRKWHKWKEKEEKQLQHLGVEEQVIKQLREYDWNEFKKERLYLTRHILTNESFFLNRPIYDKKEINNIRDLLDSIQDEALFFYLSKTDTVTLRIILLRLLGYSTKEISKELNLSCAAIYKRINRLKKELFEVDVKK
ncbi:sigma factor-like helix-turn-helix DNA-binding protein [Thomasclavelia cocleata]|uniref:sigma factor-like helix-turn-helix DNA-binding protein n=1 Tax=Thomasclavelia cocleata TaxID=69824 RepID=UPI00242E7F24|nr:sigma factor-like helix-turn-helix DNA-binding protein [Thomasclavelia cocleata]